MGRFCDSCQGVLEASQPLVTATRQSAPRRSHAHPTATATRSYHFHQECWERVSLFGGYQRLDGTSAA